MQDLSEPEYEAYLREVVRQLSLLPCARAWRLGAGADFELEFSAQLGERPEFRLGIACKNWTRPLEASDVQPLCAPRDRDRVAIISPIGFSRAGLDLATARGVWCWVVARYRFGQLAPVAPRAYPAETEQRVRLLSNLGYEEPAPKLTLVVPPQKQVYTHEVVQLPGGQVQRLATPTGVWNLVEPADAEYGFPRWARFTKSRNAGEPDEGPGVAPNYALTEILDFLGANG